MWYFSSPMIVFGEDALSHLATLKGQRAVLVTDKNLVRVGLHKKVLAQLEATGIQIQIYDQVEPEPSLETISAGAQAMLDFQPDWIIALGGGSVIDAAKGMWVLYARPGTDPESINPIEEFGLRDKARFAAIPTTSGTGAEATWAVVLTNRAERRKLALGTREALPDIAIIDPAVAAGMPARLTADTALDTLTHAVEGFTSTYHTDFTDGLCLKAVELVFDYLPRAYQNGDDMEAREHLHNAATIAGLGFGNSMAALAHGLGHSLGAVFHIPHGRAVSLFLPYSIEYCLNGEPDSTRYGPLARYLSLPHASEKEAGKALAESIRRLQKSVGQPLTMAELGITRQDLEAEMNLLVDNAMNDTQTIMATRIPDNDDIRQLFFSAFEGATIDY
jgi:alcohol dehydrogenase class IV